MTKILQTGIPYDPTQPAALPGISPLAMEDWLKPDDVALAQIAERDRLLRDQREEVLYLEPDAMPAARELLELVLNHLWGGVPSQVQRADGVVVRVDMADPLGTLGRITQQDFCILQKSAAEHVLTGAVVCFPASWMLSEKAGRSLLGIHDPVAEYQKDIARRVQRLFDGVQPGRPLWRFNSLWYRDATLFQPRRTDARRAPEGAAGAPFLRSEHQSILRLPQSKAVVFAIHTYVLSRADVMRLWP